MVAKKGRIAKTLYWDDLSEDILQEVKGRLGLRGDSETVKTVLRIVNLDQIAPENLTPAQHIERIERELAELEKVLK